MKDMHHGLHSIIKLSIVAIIMLGQMVIAEPIRFGSVAMDIPAVMHKPALFVTPHSGRTGSVH